MTETNHASEAAASSPDHRPQARPDAPRLQPATPGATTSAFPPSHRGKVGPATGQPRTEVPLAADGSGTVVELGEAFRLNLSNAVACLPDGAIDPTTIKIAIRNLHACVAELAQVVERIAAR